MYLGASGRCFCDLGIIWVPKVVLVCPGTCLSSMEGAQKCMDGLGWCLGAPERCSCAPGRLLGSSEEMLVCPGKMLGDSREILGSSRKVFVFPMEMLVWFLQGGTSLLCGDAWVLQGFSCVPHGDAWVPTVDATLPQRGAWVFQEDIR